MAVLTREELLNSIRDRRDDDLSDEALAFIEDIEDTITDYENKANGDGTDWKKKYEENDKAWRTKYRDRFFSGGGTEENDEPEPAPKKLTFDELFKED